MSRQSHRRTNAPVATTTSEPPQADITASGADPAPKWLGVRLPLPHERDESVSGTPAPPDGTIDQARRDIESGKVDTDMHATPGLDADNRARLVPGPGGNPST
jgi:hypothetical protein